ncbi:Glucokinase [bacterium HR12]|nr:Glucokinase [bacterium HR12]
MAAQALGLDVGGTKILGVRTDGGGRVLDRAQAPTPAEDQEATLDAMISVARGLLVPEVRAVGVGAAGMVEAGTGVLRFAPNLAWRDVPISARMAEALGRPCLVDNDANAAAFGELRFGAARGYRHVLLVTVGTGIGGGIIVDGRPFRGAHGFAAEIGHVVMDPLGPPCGCGNRGCFEQLGSGAAIGRLGREAAREDPRSRLATLAGGDPEAVTGEIVTRAALEGDVQAVGILGTVGAWLGVGIAGLVNVLDPGVVVVGGGAVTAGELLLGPARAAFRDAVEAADRRPVVPIVAATLGPEAGAIGAATLALEELGGAP